MSLARAALFNLAGHLAPLAAAVVAFPVLVGRLDPERFGFLSLAWVIVGYFSLFDLGLGRALSRLVAERPDGSDEEELPAMVRTALALTFALGAIAGATLYLLSPWLCGAVFKMPLALREEAILALRLLSACLPLVTLTAALRGLLEGRQRFGWVNAIRIPLGVLTFAAPAVLVLGTQNLVALAAVLAGLRLAGVLAHWSACMALYPGLLSMGAPRVSILRNMLGFGAWLTVSNVVGPLMVYLDRFLIGAMLSVAAVAYYSAPYEVMTRLWVLPAALTGVLFPAFAASQGRDPERVLFLYRMGIKGLLLAVFPFTFLAILFAPQWISVWLGPEYAARSALVAQILSIGVLANCLAYLPFTLLQAAGRSDVPAKTHLAELPFYIAMLALLAPRFGIEGAALAWTIRCVVDAGLLFWQAKIALPASPRLLSPAQQATIGLLCVLMLAALFPESIQAKAALGAATMLLFFALGWLVLLTSEERHLARHPLAILAGGVSR